MITAHVIVHFKPEYRDIFMKEMVVHARKSLEEEPGCYRYDVIEHPEDPNSCYVYGVYRDEAAWKAHGEAEHNKRWRELVLPWQSEEGLTEGLRKGVTLYPPDEALTKQPIA